MISERFKQLRDELGKSQTEFGAGIGVSRSVINNIERGVTEPSDVFLNHLCVVYNVNRAWLETGEGELFDKSKQLDETAKLIESISDSPAMRSLLATWAQLSDENKAVFERFAADYVEDYMRRKAEADTARTEAMLDETEAYGDISDNKSSVNPA